MPHSSKVNSQHHTTRPHQDPIINEKTRTSEKLLAPLPGSRRIDDGLPLRTARETDNGSGCLKSSCLRRRIQTYDDNVDDDDDDDDDGDDDDDDNDTVTPATTNPSRKKTGPPEFLKGVFVSYIRN